MASKHKEALNRLKMVTTREKYNDVLAKLHTCSPMEKAGLQKLLNYYYERIGK